MTANLDTRPHTPEILPLVRPERPFTFTERLEAAKIWHSATLAEKHGAVLREAADAVRQAMAGVPDHMPTLADVRPPNPVLAAAGVLILRRGWARDVFVAPDGALCALAAVRVVPCDPHREADALSELVQRIRLDLGHDRMSITRWNDTRSSREEVTRLLY